MKILHLLASGHFGGIETLIQQYSFKSKIENVFVFVWGGGVRYEEMKKHGIPCINLEEKTGRFIHTTIRILQICEQERPDVIISHHGSPHFKAVIAFLSFWNPKIKTIAYAHCDGHDTGQCRTKCKTFVSRRINNYGFKKADKIIAISESVKASLIKYFSIPVDKISVIYNGTDLSCFVSDIKQSIHDPLRFIFVGRLIQEKGVQITLQALSELPNTLNWKFDIVGDGSYRKELERLTKTLNLTERVRFMGARSDIPECLKEHDIFIHMPEWEEGFGITIIEAMAAGLLCICSAKGGIPEVISDGADGLLVHSSEELTDVLEAILTKSNQYSLNDMRENAIEKAKKFDIKSYAEQLDEMVMSL